ncbi:hypothetical protein AtNW77_Chr1g0011571 [Arabidopsis thaliana]|uniref:Core-2/I-branching beta-1,6-N-acetylglucosaminyltransferase family protein n=2 Tax=Arabidopsis thaliana TaxID=3702 RepID=A0A1P8AME6_ARATH|nr:core-2/I-branching beta-1,6-N-acetylglucosaminyltransferase family protein [Arabidopsis thaliana]ANM57830.1 core-2/I-branching beta-1,6-N-acetylglucosaminyltransferase family protein [Arabidopsis thaliana]VYS45681.1 unnamed protein product [Arabidopsis thaliana]|eukprot:NP_001320311.1 core-2/I-branching beta-1,6-N-acetylglucosaminyltransferase family protein [Arabidopsis thaliana]
MEVAKIGRKKTSRNVGHHDIVGSKRNQYHYAKSIEENENMVKEMQQQMLQIDKEIREKTYISGLEYNLNHRWRPIEDYQPIVYFRSKCPEKMVLDKLTFANNAYRDKKAVISFASGEREINIHNLNHQMLHNAHCMDGGERRLLKMLNPNKDIDSGSSLAQVEEQMWNLYTFKKWPYLNTTSTITIDEETYSRKQREFECERDQVFVNAPSKASLWKSLPSTKDLRDQIQAMELKGEQKRKKVVGRRKKIESRERKIKKTENEIKSMRKTMERILNRMHKALETISHERTCLEKKITILYNG